MNSLKVLTVRTQDLPKPLKARSESTSRRHTMAGVIAANLHPEAKDQKMTDPILVDRTIAAASLSIGLTLFNQMVSRGEIPFIPMGDKKLFRVETLKEWAKEREIKSAEEYRQFVDGRRNHENRTSS